MHDAYILDAVRTPRGRGRADKGALAKVHPQALFGATLRALVERTGIDPSLVDDVIAGCVSQAGEQGANLARNAVLHAGLPIELTATTLNRFCGSGLQAASFAAMGVASGAQDLVVAGGVESMSRVPMGSDGGGIDGNHPALRERHFQVPQGISADLIATLEHVGRDALDAFALESQRRATASIAAGAFSRSLIPVTDASGAVLLDVDEYPRADTTLEGLSKLKPAFEALGATPASADGRTFDQIALARHPEAGAISHVHTAGNSSGIVDGAAAVMMASKRFVDAHGVKPRARVRSVATLGSDPILMLTAPAPTSMRALDKAGMSPRDVDLYEINEAFAVVPIQTMRALGVEPDRVNVAGGAIALGHPLGATGAILLGTALDELERRDLATALVTLCIGGGMGIAMIVERC